MTFLTNNPLCRMCREVGTLRKATVVDHIVPHRGNQKLFWDTSNWQPLCDHCHNSIKHRQEITGRIEGATVDGLPLDHNHHWYKHT